MPPKPRCRNPSAAAGMPEVIDHDGHRQIGDLAGDLPDHRSRPRRSGCASSAAATIFAIAASRAAAALGSRLPADSRLMRMPAHALGVEVAQGLLSAIVGRHHRNAARRRAELGHRVEHAGIVGAVEARLHDHVARDADARAQRLQLRDGRLRRRVGAVRRPSDICRVRPDDVDVAIAGAGKHVGARRRRSRPHSSARPAEPSARASRIRVV